MAKKVIIQIYDAVGGPKNATMGADGFRAGPTDQGRYVVAYCGKHSSSRYAYWSRVRWGSKLEDRGGELWVQHKGKMRALKTVTPVTRQEIEEKHQELYKTKKVPDKWVFNDFGHKTCYFFKDKNKNRRLDKKAGEKISGEFIHTTPKTEAATARGETVILTESHGCVHVKPADIDEMTKKRYIATGVPLIIHTYDKLAPTGPKTVGSGPFEVHFFPGATKLVVYGRAK